MIFLESEYETTRLGRAIADVVESGVVIGLIGPLGAGKTHLVRAIAEALEVDPSAIGSPTFVLIQEYEGRIPVFHFDAFRLQTPRAFADLGVSEYWSRPGICLVEWADRVRELLPPDCWVIEIELAGPTSRLVRFDLPSSASGLIDRLCERLA
jgi:tRNA threonylcarbamoyladenosine biosynthesis protein TsaE